MSMKRPLALELSDLPKELLHEIALWLNEDPFRLGQFRLCCKTFNDLYTTSYELRYLHKALGMGFIDGPELHATAKEKLQYISNWQAYFNNPCLERWKRKPQADHRCYSILNTNAASREAIRKQGYTGPLQSQVHHEEMPLTSLKNGWLSVGTKRGVILTFKLPNAICHPLPLFQDPNNVINLRRGVADFDVDGIRDRIYIIVPIVHLHTFRVLVRQLSTGQDLQGQSETEGAPPMNEQDMFMANSWTHPSFEWYPESQRTVAEVGLQAAFGMLAIFQPSYCDVAVTIWDVISWPPRLISQIERGSLSIVPESMRPRTVHSVKIEVTFLDRHTLIILRETQWFVFQVPEKYQPSPVNNWPEWSEAGELAFVFQYGMRDIYLLNNRLCSVPCIFAEPLEPIGICHQDPQLTQIIVQVRSMMRGFQSHFIASSKNAFLEAFNSPQWYTIPQLQSHRESMYKSTHPVYGPVQNFRGRASIYPLCGTIFCHYTSDLYPGGDRASMRRSRHALHVWNATSEEGVLNSDDDSLVAGRDDQSLRRILQQEPDCGRHTHSNNHCMYVGDQVMIDLDRDGVHRVLSWHPDLKHKEEHWTPQALESRDMLQLSEEYRSPSQEYRHDNEDEFSDSSHSTLSARFGIEDLETMVEGWGEESQDEDSEVSFPDTDEALLSDVEDGEFEDVEDSDVFEDLEGSGVSGSDED